MPPKVYSRLWIAAIVVLVSVATGAALMRSRDPGIPDSGQSNRRSTTATVTRQDFLRTVRLSGTVEAVESTTVAAPRLSGPNSNSLVITKLVKPGTRVEKGDLIVEFDRQTQIATALDRRAELKTSSNRSRRRKPLNAPRAQATTARSSWPRARSSRARLEMVKNELLPKIQAEKNDLAARAGAGHAQAAEGHLRAQAESRRSRPPDSEDSPRSRRQRHAPGREQRRADGRSSRPIGGMAVVRTIWKGNNMAEVQEGEEVRAGVPVVDIVNPEVHARARARQPGGHQRACRSVRPVQGRPRRVSRAVLRRADRADLAAGRVVDALAQGPHLSSSWSTSTASHPNLMPDLTASLDVTLARIPGALVVPRDALATNGKRDVRPGPAQRSASKNAT